MGGQQQRVEEELAELEIARPRVALGAALEGGDVVVGAEDGAAVDAPVEESPAADAVGDAAASEGDGWDADGEW